MILLIKPLPANLDDLFGLAIPDLVESNLKIMAIIGLFQNNSA